ncbi:hypothetical protein SERLA73DRAFT_176393 [Serpula lacrymans var. lacrymans S7.3]|uniref:Coenzyme Q-binding protein COQ10 START domain-containing protein n=2 Tax=Serpula lacrymans var. lacrymans TaxID=341189 RepID=F8PMU2_SERL3|nr:uncharacterized protein SERLADRAFT_459244 [Serpula lacrymans var. lacrymans S7.9]EGO02924.1 hypothetical protein SERLA73DRAFT_176393 [Serpula lacrymans var. lacrymans S7.3]EGO28613.1 hypothetical protein SERLADRAFT_459244 [Serpula lacrymans var. lacrymans S7.9]
MSTSSGLPPVRANGVFALSANIIIDAPREKVWEVLMDWKSYREWNAFVRNQQLTDARKNPLADQTPSVGSYLLISPVHIPPTMSDKWLPSSAFERITALDRDNFRVAWENIEMPRWLLNAERWQALSEVEGEPGKTRYETIEVFGGVVAYIVKVLFRKGLNEGFAAMAEGLKRRSEERQ